MNVDMRRQVHRIAVVAMLCALAAANSLSPDSTGTLCLTVLLKSGE